MSPPGWKALILDTGEGRTTVTSTFSEDVAGVPKPQGGTAVDNATTEKMVVSHINLREKMRNAPGMRGA